MTLLKNDYAEISILISLKLKKLRNALQRARNEVNPALAAKLVDEVEQFQTLLNKINSLYEKSAK